MTGYLEAIVLGVIQGITEWLPISSSGHLVLAQKLFGLDEPLIFDIVLHLATIMVIGVVFRKDIVKILHSLFPNGDRNDRRIAWLIVIASIPTAIIGFAFESFFESLFQSIRAVALGLIVTGFLLLFTKRNGKKDLTTRDALLIGTMQGVAIAPGVSRSGATISTGILCGVERNQVTTFSFLMAIPAVLGASLLKMNEISQVQNIPALLVAATVSFIVGFFCLKWLIQLVKKQRLIWFSFYCFGLGLLVLAISYS